MEQRANMGAVCGRDKLRFLDASSMRVSNLEQKQDENI